MPYQAETDANGGYTRVSQGHTWYGWGVWKWSVFIGNVTKYVEFTAGGDSHLTTDCRECSPQDGITFSIVGAPPNSPIYWLSKRDLVLTREQDWHYGQSTDHYGCWRGSTGCLVGNPGWPTGQWVKQARIGDTYLTVDFRWACLLLKPGLCDGMRYGRKRRERRRPYSPNDGETMGRQRIAGMKIEEVITAARSPWPTPFVERLIGSIRRECLDHMFVLSENHLRRILKSYFAYYHRS
jgi:hypothetical protein